MPALKIILIAVTLIMAAYVMYLGVTYFERVIRSLGHKIPFLPSINFMRNAVTHEINTHYSHMNTVCEIGSGYGGLARQIARECDMRVIALENMAVTAFVSKIADCITRCNCKTIWCDAFKHIPKMEKFDIAVMYMGPNMHNHIDKIKPQCRVMISLDFPIKNLTPSRTVDLNHGSTIYGGVKYPHKLFIYEN